jgi:hypothetical protein
VNMIFIHGGISSSYVLVGLGIKVVDQFTRLLTLAVKLFNHRCIYRIIIDVNC